MLTRPMSYPPAEPEKNKDKAGLVERIQGALRYAKYGLAGAIGAVAFVHTLDQFGIIELTTTIESLALAAGAIAMVAAGKFARVL
jgi:hypothetical protein